MANTIINGGASPYPKHVGPAAICSFSDGAQDAPLKSLKFYVEPQQDLHGYSYPWPGGGGVNKLPSPAATSKTNNGITIAVNNGVYSISGTATALAEIIFDLPSDVTYDNTYKCAFLNTAANSGVTVYWRYNSTNGTSYGFGGGTNRVAEYSSSGTFNKVRFVINSGTAISGTLTTSPVLCLKSVTTPTSFSPYSNICPISGWSQVDGKQSGEDMTDYTPIAISLGQTVYGGTVDALMGEGESGYGTYNLKSHNQSYITQYDYNGKHGVMINYALPSAQSRAAGWCDTAPVSTEANYNSNQYMWFGVNSTAVFWIGILDALGVDLAGFKTWLAAHDVTICRPLASPTSLTLAPVSVSSLLGQNNIWCNTGDTELDYYPAAASVVAVLNRSSKVYTSIPLGKIRYDTYQTTPNQALDLDSYRAETGVLIRNVLSHTATKIEFNTPSMTNLQWEEVWNIIKAGFNNSTERKLKLKYYDQMSATYKTGWFYVPDVQFTIRNIDEANGIINYDEVRVAFIEY